MEQLILEKLDKLDILDSLTTNVNGIKKIMSDFQHSISKYKEKLRDVESQLEEMRKEKASIQSRLDYMDKMVRRNNIIIFGLDENEKNPRDLRRFVVKFFIDQLQVNIDVNQVDNATRIGTPNPHTIRPIRIMFTDNHTKWEVLNAASNLKGINVGMRQDLTKNERAQMKSLFQIKKLLLENGQRAKIFRRALIIDGRPFTLEEAQRFTNSDKNTTPGSKIEAAIELANRKLKTNPPGLRGKKICI